MLKVQSVIRFTKAVVFCLVLLFLLEIISYAFKPLNNTAEAGMINDSARGFYSESCGDNDIYFIGNSNAYAGFSPMVFWKNYGFTSYVACESGQNTAQACYILNEILEKRKPKLIILETDEFYDSGYHVIIDTVFSRTVPLLYNHRHWKNFKPGDVLKKPEYTRHQKNRGYWPYDNAAAYRGGEYMVPTEEREKIPFSAIPAIEIFIKKCRDNNIPLLLVHLPSATNWNYKRHNSVSDFAEKHGLPFIDYDCERKTIGFDWKTDSRDEGNHLNNRGAHKIAMHLGEYLKINYSLQDHRGEAGFEVWDSDYVGYPDNASERE